MNVNIKRILLGIIGNVLFFGIYEWIGGEIWAMCGKDYFPIIVPFIVVCLTCILIIVKWNK